MALGHLTSTLAYKKLLAKPKKIPTSQLSRMMEMQVEIPPLLPA